MLESPTRSLIRAMIPSVPTLSIARAVIRSKPQRASLRRSSFALIRGALMPAWIDVFFMRPCAVHYDYIQPTAFFRFVFAIRGHTPYGQTSS